MRSQSSARHLPASTEERREPEAVPSVTSFCNAQQIPLSWEYGGVHPALLSHRPVNLFPLTASLRSGSPPPPVSALSSSILTRPSSRRDLLISHVLMLSHPRLCHLRGAPGPGIALMAQTSLTSQSPSPASPAAPPGRCPSPDTGGVAAIPPCLHRDFSPAADPPGAAAGTGWIRSRARCQRSGPSRRQPSPEKAKHGLCLHLSVHSQAVKADCRSPFPWLRLPESPPGWH